MWGGEGGRGGGDAGGGCGHALVPSQGLGSEEEGGCEEGWVGEGG